MFFSLLIILFSFGFNQEIPPFDENRAMELLKIQCSFGPRYPGSTGHDKMKNFMKNFLFKLSDSLYVMDENTTHPSGNRKLHLTNF